MTFIIQAYYFSKTRIGAFLRNDTAEVKIQEIDLKGEP
jgi:hypothetical protein